MNKFKNLSTNEKVLISFMLVLVVVIAFNCKDVANGLLDSFKPYFGS